MYKPTNNPSKGLRQGIFYYCDQSALDFCQPIPWTSVISKLGSLCFFIAYLGWCIFIICDFMALQDYKLQGKKLFFYDSQGISF